MKDGFVGQRRFVGHEKRNHSRIIFVCMKYKCQRGLVIQGCCGSGGKPGGKQSRLDYGY